MKYPANSAVFIVVGILVGFVLGAISQMVMSNASERGILDSIVEHSDDRQIRVQMCSALLMGIQQDENTADLRRVLMEWAKAQLRSSVRNRLNFEEAIVVVRELSQGDDEFVEVMRTVLANAQDVEQEICVRAVQVKPHTACLLKQELLAVVQRSSSIKVRQSIESMLRQCE